MINHSNIEEYIIEFLDGELSPGQIESFNDFLNQHPEYQSLVEEYSRTIVKMDNINPSYPNKNLLLKNEINILRKLRIPIGIAASIGLIIGLKMTLDENIPPIDTLSKVYNTARPNGAKQQQNGKDSSRSTSVQIANHSNTRNYRTKNNGIVPVNHKKTILYPTIKEDEKEMIQPQPIAKIYLINEEVPKMDYHIDIKASYVQWENQAEWPKDESDLEIGIGQFTLPNTNEKFKSFVEKLETKKEKILDGLALLNELEIPLSKN